MDYVAKINELETKISKLENTVDKLNEGNFKTITANRIILKENQVENSENKSGIYIYSKENDLLFKTATNNRGSVTSDYFYNGKDNLNLGICEHGAGRLKLNNIDGNSMIFIGSTDNVDNHSARIQLWSQDKNGQITLQTSNRDQGVLRDDWKNNIDIEQTDYKGENYDSRLTFGTTKVGSKIELTGKYNDQKWTKRSPG